MKTKPPTPLIALSLLVALAGLAPVSRADPPPACECCALVLPAAPANAINFALSWAYPPEASDSFLTATVLAGGAVPPGVYASWCVDAQTGLLPGIEGYDYVGSLYLSTDPKLNQYLQADTTNASALVGPDAWKDVNYIINHRAGYNYWDVQAAIWHFIGGPAVATPPYPGFNLAAVSQLVGETLSNAPAWVPQRGDKVAVVALITWAVDIQIVIIEVPCPGATPSLALSVDCPTACGVVDFSGSVSNQGGVTLTNVLVFGSQPSDHTLLAGPLSLAPGGSSAFTGIYTVPCVTNLATNLVSAVTTNTSRVVVTNTTPVITTNTILVVRTNTVGLVTTNTNPVITTNTLLELTTNLVVVVSTNITPVITTNTVLVITTNTLAVVVTNTLPVITTNTVLIITTNTVFLVTTNVVEVIATNTIITFTTNAVGPTFGTIDPVSGILTDRFSVVAGLHGLMFADQDQNWGPTLFYSIRYPLSGPDFLDTISTIPPSVGVVADRIVLSSTNYDALTLSAPDVGYGAVNFYYVRHDNSGISSFGVIKAAGASSSADLWVIPGTGYNGLAFAAADLGYGANLFYFLRQGSGGVSTFGTINPTPGGIVTDRYAVGTNFDSLVFVPGAVSTWGTGIFAYLRHDQIGSIIGTINPVTHVVTDKLHLGANFLDALTFTATDVGYGPNLFYYLRPGISVRTTNTVTSFTTNSVTSFTTNSVITFGTNSVTSYVTNQVVSFTTNSVITFGTNSVTSYATNQVVSFTTNSVITFGTNSVTTFATNTVISYTTNSVTTFITNSVIGFTTNNVISFSTNSITTRITNSVITLLTNVVAGAVTNVVTARGMDICQGLTVTATAICSEQAAQTVPLLIGGGGAESPRYSNGEFRLSFASQTGRFYTVQYKTALGDPTWTDVQTVSGTGGFLTVTHTVGGQAACFYRVVISP